MNSNFVNLGKTNPDFPNSVEPRSSGNNGDDGGDRSAKWRSKGGRRKCRG